MPKVVEANKTLPACFLGLAKALLATALLLNGIEPTETEPPSDDHKVPEAVHGAILRSIDLFFQNKYLECIQVNKDMQGTHDHLLNYLFEAAGYFYIMYDYRNLAYKEVFEARIEAIIERSKKAVETNPNNPWGHFSLGSAYAYRGAYKAQILDKWFSGYRDGLKAKGFFEDLLDDDTQPTIHDVYYGMGMFLFWRGYYTKNFSWLVPSKGQKAKGIRYLLRSTTKGVYTHYFSQASLIQVYYVNSNFGKAIRAADALLETFPNYIPPYYYLALMNLERKNTKETIRMKEWILEQVTDLPHVGSVGLARLKYQLGDIHYGSENHKQAQQYFSQVLELEADHPENEKEFRKLQKLSERRLKKSKKTLASSN